MKLSEKAQNILDNLTVARSVNFISGKKCWHAVHPVTNEALCDNGRRATLGFNRPFVAGAVTCVKCNAAIAILRKAAKEIE